MTRDATNASQFMLMDAPARTLAAVARGHAAPLASEEDQAADVAQLCEALLLVIDTYFNRDGKIPYRCAAAMDVLLATLGEPRPAVDVTLELEVVQASSPVPQEGEHTVELPPGA